VLPIRDLTRCCRCSLSAPERTNNGGAVARVAAASGRRTSGPQQGTCAACSSGRAGQRGTSPCSCVHQHSGPVQRGAPTNSGAVPRLPRSSAAHAESPGGGGHPGPLSLPVPSACMPFATDLLRRTILQAPGSDRAKLIT
jgi:hypothetical protein